jgi:hypothetical protein
MEQIKAAVAALLASWENTMAVHTEMDALRAAVTAEAPELLPVVATPAEETTPGA